MVFDKVLKINKIVFFIFIIIFFVASISDADARRRKRSYNPKATKQQAIEIIRSTSESVSEMAGLEPNVDSLASSTHLLGDEGEILDTEGDHGENIEELEQEDDVVVTIEDFTNIWMSYLDDEVQSQYTNYGIKKTDIMEKIMEYLGTPYRFGGTSDRALDCSAFTQRIFSESANIMLPRVAREQVNVGKKIKKKDLQFGDMVFFYTYSKRFASHVGIYLGDNLFAHASSRHGVTVSSLESSYYKKNFLGARRLTSKDIESMSVKPKEYLNATRKK